MDVDSMSGTRGEVLKEKTGSFEGKDGMEKGKWVEEGISRRQECVKKPEERLGERVAFILCN